jgi:hypothetical protein
VVEVLFLLETDHVRDSFECREDRANGVACIALWTYWVVEEGVVVKIYICIDLIILMLDTTDEKKLGRDHHG